MPPTRPATAIAPPRPHTRDLRKALRPCPRLPADGGDRHPSSPAFRCSPLPPPAAFHGPGRGHRSVGPASAGSTSIGTVALPFAAPAGGTTLPGFAHRPAPAGIATAAGGLHRRRPSPLRLHPVRAPERRAPARRLPWAGGPAIPGLPRAGTGPPGSRLPRSAVPSRAGTGARPGARNRARNGEGRPRAPGTRQPSLRSACA